MHIIGKVKWAAEETFLIKDIEYKAMALPYDEDLVLIPILHGCH